MATDNLSVVLNAIDDIRLEQWPMPEQPGNNEVLLKTYCVGICGSDIHYWKHGSIGHFILTSPMILGHETCAEVVAVGPDVTDFKPGDRVCTEPAVPCRLCNYCKEGFYNLCLKTWCHSTPPRHGTLTKYFLHPADFTFKLPDNITNEEGAMIEPLAVGVYACRRAQVSVGKDVLICGSGPIGLVNIMVAKAFGANKICVTDINAERLKVAKEVGADITILVERSDTTDGLSAKVEQLIGRKPDITIECSGAPSSTRLAFKATRSGGRAVIVGMGPNDVELPIQDAMIREVEILGSFRYRNCFPLAISLVASGKVNLKPMATHRYLLEQSVDAFNAANDGKGIKHIIHVRPESG